MRPPSVKLVGRGGKGDDELAITAEVPFYFALDGYRTYTPVLVQPDSDIQCLLGMNVIPSFGIWVKQVHGEVMTEPTAPEPLAEAKVYLIQSTRIQGIKGTVLEAKVDLPVAGTMGSLLFKSDQEFLASMGMVSVDVLLPSTKEGQVLVFFANHFPVAADLEAGTCVGNVTVVTRGQSV